MGLAAKGNGGGSISSGSRSAPASMCVTHLGFQGLLLGLGAKATATISYDWPHLSPGQGSWCLCSFVLLCDTDILNSRPEPGTVIGPGGTVGVLLTELHPLNSLSSTKITNGGFPGGAVVENLPANAGDTGSSPGLGRSHMTRSS